jgi:hypothetical protein
VTVRPGDVSLVRRLLVSIGESADNGEGPTGWAAVPNWVVRDPDIDRTTKMVYLVLSSHAGARKVCWPSQTTIAETIGVSTRTVKRALSDLRTMGLLTVKVRRTPHGRRNDYHLHIHPFSGDGDTGGPTHGDTTDPRRRT